MTGVQGVGGRKGENGEGEGREKGQRQRRGRSNKDTPCTPPHYINTCRLKDMIRYDKEYITLLRKSRKVAVFYR